MTVSAKYVHTNIVARDWKRLARFYQQVFDCVPVPPERDLSGQLMEDATCVTDAHICGTHLRLPGYIEDGPTLEIFQYNCFEENATTAVNRPGFAHIAFSVDNVKSAQEVVLAAGGSTVGKCVTIEVSNAGIITFVYVKDPEGNIIELQHWSKV
jgi:predicted enzyme related to lactoylglutathione lyase